MLTHISADIAILGGQSAIASAAFQYRLACRLHTRGARTPTDYPKIVQWSLGLESPEHVAQALAQLRDCGPAIIAAPCNSITPIIDELSAQGALDCPVMTPVHALNNLVLNGTNLVLGVANTAKQKLVQFKGGVTRYPDEADQAWVLQLYHDIVANGPTYELGLELQTKARAWHATGIDRVVLACTEFSLLVPDQPGHRCSIGPFDWIDGMAELISVTIEALPAPG
ncbi:MAG: aspartate/glutamate racemase family protein [Agitococcus sp.]|nr:aspartate/glutamate racemase family protein [Agitococcus sp.]